jgi:PAS domain S-box-containing protein
MSDRKAREIGLSESNNIIDDKKLQETTQKLQAIITASPLAIVNLTPDGKVVMWNQAAEKIFGWSESEVLGKDLPIVPEDKQAEFQMLRDRVIRGESFTEMKVCRKKRDGTLINISISTAPIYDNQGCISGIMAVITDISKNLKLEAERLQLLQKLTQESKDLIALNTITDNAISTLNLVELLNILLQRIVQVTKADTGVILLKEGDRLRVRASLGIEQEQRGEFSVAIGQGFAGNIAASLQPLYIEDVQTDPLIISPILRQLDIRTMMGVPLKRNGTLVGVLHVDWFNKHPFSDRELRLLEITAERCAMAIINAQLYEQTKQLQERLQLQIERMPIGCILKDKNFQIIDWNPAAEKIFGYSKQEVLGKYPDELIILPAARAFVQQMRQQLAAGEITDRNLMENITKDGQIVTCEWHNTPIKDTNNQIISYLSMVQDVSERKLAEDALKESERRYHTLAQISPVAIFRTDAIGQWLYVNDRWCQMTGLSISQSLQKGWQKAIHPAHQEQIFALWEKAIQENLPFQSEYRLLNVNGTITWVFGQAIPEQNQSGKIIGYVGTLTDITDRKQAEEKLQRYAYYDPMTGLPNRTFFLKQLEQTINLEKQHQSGLFAVLFLNLDRFQMVKFSLGHHLADRLLIASAERIQKTLQNSEFDICQFDFETNLIFYNQTFSTNCISSHAQKERKSMVAQIGLDEFAILLTNLREPKNATHLAEQIYQALSYPFDLNGQEVFISTSIGIAFSSVGYKQPEDYLRAADTAMHQSKQLSKTRYAIFEPGWQIKAVERLQLETDLRRAIERQELQVHYQPIISIKTGNLIGFEALVRWYHSTKGWISPVDFIPLAEETGLISLIDRSVLKEACQQMVIWQQKYPKKIPLTISVNLSAVQLAQLGLIERIDRILKETKINRKSLKIEITETSLTGNSASETAMLQQLKSLGIQLSIDDFGTGYSSLARLRQLPIDTLKIDRSFVHQMAFDSESLEIVRTIISLAHILEMDVIAEGVETAEQLLQLQSLECEYSQGFFFSKPVDRQTAESLISVNHQFISQNQE